MPNNPVQGAQGAAGRKLPQIYLHLTLLGHMRVRDGTGRDITPRIRKSRAVLAMLALAAPRPILRDELASLLWSRRDREQARASLRQCVHELQALLAPINTALLLAERNHLVLATEGVWIDVRAGAAGVGPLLNDLIGLDPAFDRWLQTERRRIGRAASAVAEAALVPQTRPDFEPAAAIFAAEQLLAIDPIHEGGWRALIAAHSARGDRAAAIEAYRRCITTLSEKADIAPSAETQALFEAIRSGPRTAAPQPRSVRRNRIRFGVRPFRVFGTTTTDRLSLGLAEEISAALSRFKWLFLIASPSLAAIAIEPGHDDPHWRELALDFVLDGTVERSNGRIHVTVRLLDIKAGPEIVWTGRFDRAAADILTLQDDIASETVARIDPDLIDTEIHHRVTQTPSNAIAYELVLSSIPAIYRLDEPSFREAGTALAEAVRIDPGYAASHAWWACWHLFLVGQNWADDPAVAMSHAAMLAERAVALDPSDARGVTIAGHVRAFLYHRIDQAIELHDRALSLNPNLPLAWVFSGLAEAYAGRHSEALSRVHHARELSPFDPHTFFFDMALMIAHFLRKEFSIVVDLARRSLALNAGFTSTYKVALAALGHLGQRDDARILRQRLLTLEPGFRSGISVSRTPIQIPDDIALYAEGLRLAGLPE